MLGKLTRQNDPNLLVGYDTADDAGVYLIGPDRALVQTVDFFTPIVDDPYTYGQIAAVNALSDVYAMGGTPITALAIVCFPDGGDLEVLERILAGGLSKMVEAGCTVVGGHSVRDPEIKFGYSVTGSIDPQRILANSAARPGDALIFTKCLGTGVISTAIKRDLADPGWIAAATRSMTTLNRTAAEVITRKEFDVHACTDITGFGLAGHAREMAIGSKVALRIRAGNVPLLPGAEECVRKGYLPGGLANNRSFAECDLAFADEVSDAVRSLMFDPQTAGGLLVSVAAAHAEQLETALRDAAVEAAIIGEVIEQQPDQRKIQFL